MRTVLVGAAILGLAGTGASAQTGGVRVRVIDQSDKGPLPGVTVTLSNSMQLAPTSTVVTDIDGNALFPVLRAGSGYSVEVFLQGYAKQRLSDLKVRVNETTDVPIAMTTEIQEKVIVTGKRDVVDLEKTTSSTKFSDEFLPDLPVAGRFYQRRPLPGAGGSGHRRRREPRGARLPRAGLQDHGERHQQPGP